MGVIGALQGWQRQLIRSFGRKQGIVRAASAQLAFLAGRYDPLELIDWQRVERLVFVCRGNICRSPYAEARARDFGLATSSFGLATRGGAQADPLATLFALARGLDLRPHRSRRPPELVLGAGDLLVAMEPAQARLLVPLARPAGAQLTLLGLWCLPVRPHLEDPFGLAEAYFSTCFDIIDRSVDGIAQRLRLARGGPAARAPEAGSLAPGVS